ncbi:MAG TPA: Na+/H+ antiporter NhaA [Urbifossiella sp.]|nr:Na+/H+ antiporter NhaA [Urbifossiella sp.]
MSLAEKLPQAPVDRITRPLARFLRIESAGGIVLLACAIAALAIANSPAGEAFERMWHTPVAFRIGNFAIGGTLGHFVINDVLMTVFFFVVGLEIKRELVAGELRDPRKAALPVIAALGGMIVPAAIYLALRHGQPGERGWGIPMATDIAFVVGILTLLGNRVPPGLKIMLLTLAIADDIGAIVVIAVFYNAGLDGTMLILAAAGVAAIIVLRILGVRSILAYFALGAFVWLGVSRSGVHPTIAGVILGILTPTGSWVRRASLRLALVDMTAELTEDGEAEASAADLKLLAFAAKEAVSPLDRLVTMLHPWVGFVIMPVFALANAGVAVNARAFGDPIAVAAALGLLLGKPVGVLLFSRLAVRCGLARLPAGTTWKMMIGAGILAGIGFTMSLFIAGLALDDIHLAAGKVGTLMGSVASAIVGAVVLAWAARSNITPQSGHPSAPGT